MLHGGRNPGQAGYVGNTPPIERLGIPALNLNDGPQGFRSGGTTCWPSGLTVATTWDMQAMRSWGEAMGGEFFGKGANVQLGPGVCVARVPNCGRNFECVLRPTLAHDSGIVWVPAALGSDSDPSILAGADTCQGKIHTSAMSWCSPSSVGYSLKA